MCTPYGEPLAANAGGPFITALATLEIPLGQTVRTFGAVPVRVRPRYRHQLSKGKRSASGQTNNSHTRNGTGKS
ncbi:hypothetical protein ACRALDRAFT_205946 [Sodiomyces alcalophilus JCM 7366]|uniref:uncharacterized protein n=1 Tax=Sodiomyces alcalophilus JCM 7366 TaxID=591952 RepID=UPI0039B6D85E